MADYDSIYTGAEIDRRLTDVDSRIALPSPAYAGLFPMANAQGNVSWVPKGQPTDAQTAAAVSAWLVAHPEATTTVQDGSLTHQKFSAALKTEVGGRTNPNLLDNWYFGNPVNQRGAGTAGNPWTSGYGIDRWYIHNPQSGAEVRVETTGITIDNSGGAATLNVVHKMERQLSVGDTITLSVLLQDGSIKSNKGVITESGTVAQVNIPSAAALYYAKSGNWVVAGVYAGQSVSIRAVKLELGSVSTLANDAPPNYAEELAKCQRYYYRMQANRAWTRFANGMVDAAGRADMLINLPITMRDIPSVIVSGAFKFLVGNTSYSVNEESISVATDNLSTNTITLRYTGSATLQIGVPCAIQSSGSLETYIAAVADL